MKLVSEIKKIYWRIQKPISYIFLFIGVLASVIGWPQFQLSAILAVAFIVLQILFEIHSELVNYQKISSVIYDDYNRAFPEMQRVIQEQIRKEKRVSLKWLGTCMDIGWLFIKRYLIEEVMSKGENITVEIEVAMLDPAWKDFDGVNPFWKTETKNRYEEIEKFIIEHSNSNSAAKVNIKLSTYDHMPSYTGLLVDDKYLFLAICQWDKGQYGVGKNSYTLYKKDGNNESQKQISQYKDWFEFCSRSSTSVNP
jgi:hypothetical protein